LGVKATESLGELAARYALRAGQEQQLDALLEVLALEARAPTAVRERERSLAVHVADSLVALELEELRSAGRLADIGSGAGLPGAVLAVALPECGVSLVESERRKCEFIATLLECAQIENARAVCTRVEDWPEGIGVNDVVSSRALAPQPVVLEYAAPLLRVGGALIDWRGRRDEEEERSAARAAAELGMELAQLRHVQPFAGARDHHLHVFMKVRETPARYPRRAGVARKRPLGRADGARTTTATPVIGRSRGPARRAASGLHTPTGRAGR